MSGHPSLGGPTNAARPSGPAPRPTSLLPPGARGVRRDGDSTGRAVRVPPHAHAEPACPRSGSPFPVTGTGDRGFSAGSGNHRPCSCNRPSLLSCELPTPGSDLRNTQWRHRTGRTGTCAGRRIAQLPPGWRSGRPSAAAGRMRTGGGAGRCDSGLLVVARDDPRPPAGTARRKSATPGTGGPSRPNGDAPPSGAHGACSTPSIAAIPAPWRMLRNRLPLFT
jgi:hypothetical protein